MASSRKPAKTRNHLRKPPLIKDEAEEELESEDEAEEPKPTYDPATHTCIPHETLHALVRAKSELDAYSLKAAEADAKKVESLIMGFSTNASLQGDQLARAYEFGNAQRDEAERLRKQVTDKDLELSHMVRQSEEAKLERERLAAEVERGRLGVKRLEAELSHKLQMKEAELETVRRASAPVFAAAGQGLQQLLMAYGPQLMAKVAGVSAGSGGLPPAQSTDAKDAKTPGSGDSSPVVRVSGERIEEWRTAFLAVFNASGPTAIACLRAATCSAIIPGISEKISAKYPPNSARSP